MCNGRADDNAMMFKRRQKRHPVTKLKEMIWPRMGWDRAIDYFRHRLFRNSDSTHKITGGLAIGVGVSFTPFLGFHLAFAAFLAWAFRFNIIAALIGTVIGNPWTFPFFFWLDYQIGTLIFQAFGVESIITLPEILTLEYLFQNPLKLFLPMTVGGIICAVAVWPLAYLALFLPVKGMRRAYRYQRLRKKRNLKK
ncbi:MAG: DUF2062 domain-containing protein [Micavibrio sp.]